MPKPEISIVIPVFNSSKSLPELYKRISSALTEINHELVCVNDGSCDESWKVLSELALKNSNITAIDLIKNSGQDNAILAGLRNVKGNYVVIMDDDLQHAPEDIPALYKKCREGFDVCFAAFSHKRQNIIKKTGSLVNGGIATWLLNKPRGIYLSPFKIMTRNIANEIARFSGPYPYIAGILLTITQNVCQQTVEHHKRPDGKSNYNISRSASVMFKLFTGFSVAPLRLIAIIGLIVALFGFGLILYYLYDFFITKNFVEGWTTIVVLIIFFGGLTIMLLGVIGEYIGRIYLTLNNKPQYSIREIIKKNDNND